MEGQEGGESDFKPSKEIEPGETYLKGIRFLPKEDGEEHRLLPKQSEHFKDVRTGQRPIESGYSFQLVDDHRYIIQTDKLTEIASRFNGGDAIIRGAGIVAPVHDDLLERDLVVKFKPLRSAWTAFFSSADRARKYYEEVRNVSRLNHPNIVKILDLVATEINGSLTPGLVMEPLKELPQSPELLSHQDVGTLALQIGSALDYLHSQQLLHFDVKPDNIMIREKEDGGKDFVLTDFGSAQDFSESATKINQNTITARYADPQQLKRDSPLGLFIKEKLSDSPEKADQHALAISLYQLLTGPDVDPYKTFYGFKTQLHGVGISLAPFPKNFDIPPEVYQVLKKAAATKREDRYPDCSTMAAEFAKALNPPPFAA